MSASFQLRKTTGDLGGAATATQVSATAMNNLFDNVAPDEAVAGDTEYRAVDLYNSGDAAGTLMKVYSSQTPNPNTELEIGIEASPIGSTSGIANESTAPAGVSFAQRTQGSPLSLPDIPVGQYCRLWLKRPVTAGAPNLAQDLSTLTWEYA